MQRTIWKSLKEAASSWRVWALPGAVVIGLVMGARMTGSLQSLELFALDSFLRLRPVESPDDRVVLIGIDETDLKNVGYPIPEKELVALLSKIQTYKPAVIGLHIFQTQIARVENTKGGAASLNQIPNLFVSEKVLPAAEQIPASPGFSTKQVGVIDILPDPDTHIRHMILGIFDPIDSTQFKQSLAIRLSETYLLSQDSELSLKNGMRDPDAMRFGSTELPRLEENSGGYVNAQVGSPEILLNFRNNPQPFRQLSLSQIKTGNFDPNWLRDRIVIVGISDPKIRPTIPTAAISDTNSLQLQAHTVSQIISAVMDGRPLIEAWEDGWEYLWIFTWGCFAILLGRSSLTPRTKLIWIGMIQLNLLVVSYLLLLVGWWIPVIPASFVWLLLGVGFTAFYKYDWVLRSRLRDNQVMVEERQRTIEQTFNVIHNGPLQTLANLLRRIRDSNFSQEQLLSTLEGLNAEIRNISDHLKQETLTKEDSLYLGSGNKINLKLPIHELFYEVYSNTLDRPDFLRFETIKVACDFEPIEPDLLTTDQKRDLCRFLEEALCNVGKHAEGATRLEVMGTHQKNCYVLRVVDNGKGVQSSLDGEGTRYARKLATQLKGKFKRHSLAPKGTLCELSFPLTKSQFW